MNFLAQSGKLSITEPGNKSSPSCCRKRDSKFSKEREIEIPIELVGYRIYDMEGKKEIETSHLGLEAGEPEEEGIAGLPVTEYGSLDAAFKTLEEVEELPVEDGDENEKFVRLIEFEPTTLREDTGATETPPYFSHDNFGDDDHTSLISSSAIKTPLVFRRPYHYHDQQDDAPKKAFTKNGTAIQFLQSFLNFCYYAGIMPYKFQTIDIVTGSLQLYECQPQRVFCGFVHIWVIWFGANKWTDPNLYLIFKNEAMFPKEEYLKFVSALMETLFVLTFILISWTKKDIFAWLCEEYIVEYPVEPIHGKYNQVKASFQNKFFISTILIALFSLIGLNLFLCEYLTAEDEHWFGVDGYIERQAKSFIFIDPDNEQIDEVHPIIVGIASFLYVFSGFMYALLFSMIYLFFGILGLLVNDIGKYFVEQLKHEHLTIDEGLNLYERIKKYLNALNDGFGLLVLAIVLAVIPFIGANLKISVLMSSGWLKRIVIVLMTMDFISFFWFASNFTKQIKRFREWFGKHRDNCSSEELVSCRIQSINGEIAEEMIGLNGCDFFTITNGFVGSLVQLFAIYTFISITPLQ